MLIHLSCVPHRYRGPNLVLKYNRTENRLMNIAVDDSDSPFFALRDKAGNAIGVTACDVDGDGREEIYFLNTNNAYSGKWCTILMLLKNPLNSGTPDGTFLSPSPYKIWLDS